MIFTVRKAGELANDPDVFQSIWKHLKSDGVEDQAANHMTAEILTHEPDEFESSVEQYQRNLANYRERGFNKKAAQAMAIEHLETGENPPESLRFARIYQS